MTQASAPETIPTILLIGASRGLGLAMAAEFLTRGWRVVGTVQGGARTSLHDLADEHPGRVEIAPLDINEPAQIAALRGRLDGRSFEMLFHNAGIADANPRETAAEVSTEAFVRVMVTNALSPMRVIEGLQDLVPPDGVIGVMSSGQGSVSNNERGGAEVYRASKSALNQLMRTCRASGAPQSRALVLMGMPGWIRTALGDPPRRFGVEETDSGVDVLIAQQ